MGQRVRLTVALLTILVWTQVAYATDEWHSLAFNDAEWQRDGAPTYSIEGDTLVFDGEGRGRLMTKRTYRDFELQLEFRVSAGANNGIALRAPIGFQASRYGMEIQILDDGRSPTDMRRVCGAIYGVYPARKSTVKPAGAWNRLHIRCIGRRVQVNLNGETIVDADLNSVRNRELLRERPGFLREEGHIGFIQHNGRVEFRNLRIREFRSNRAPNKPPDGFIALFNGRDLQGWQSWYADPPDAAAMGDAARQQAQAKANAEWLSHWRVQNAELVFDGKGVHLITERAFADFELCLEWKIERGGDSGIYLRDTPQVQIWDHPDGSGGLFNNEQHRNKPLTKADNPPGEWNRFRILMIGDRVTVWLNEVLVVYDTPLESYWDKRAPLPPEGRIWLQAHGTPLRFRNIFIRPL
ncbi:MAG: hypothetical protein CFK49_08725 [Armatimonadetes bacterium JP3_11]|nr:MAG: hypothetical protein CFK48_08880 [Armatimonadetes bacterium CP1_7O]OYT74381.1 MAG: hypothetical protein CFK49_08725 [Armatimonadetes bacterium JP3_11]RMH06351.1 MAG: DUF1080 domain-containing protein [Armatimonadota bacterium]